MVPSAYSPGLSLAEDPEILQAPPMSLSKRPWTGLEMMTLPMGLRGKRGNDLPSSSGSSRPFWC